MKPGLRYTLSGILAGLVVVILMISGLATLNVSSEEDEISNDEQVALNNDNGRLTGTVNLWNGDEPDQMFTSTTNYDYTGSACEIGDVNGDGYNDIIVGARGASSYSGEVRIYFGMTNTGSNLDEKDADVTLKPTGSRYAGGTVAVGDVDGDGIDDILIGSYYANSYIGEAYLYFGREEWTSASYTTPDVKLLGERGAYGGGYAYFGYNVGIEDIDDDGKGDLLVTAPYWCQQYSYPYYVNINWGGLSWRVRYNWTGLSFVFWGRTQNEWKATGGSINCNNKDPVGDGYLRIKAWAPCGNSGYMYTRMGYGNGDAFDSGDFNGDGRTDLVIGAGYYTYLYYTTSSRYTYAGATYLIEGRTRSEWMQWGGHYDMLARQGDYMMFTKRESSAYTGYNPSMGDLNGDGFDDLVIMDRASSDSYTGTANIIWGKSDVSEYKDTFHNSYPYGGYYCNLNSISTAKIKGPRSSSYMCQSHIDDFDGDGIDDILLGAYNVPNGRNQNYAGTVGLFYGMSASQWGSSYSWSDMSWTVQGYYTYNYLGYYAYDNFGSGDINNDGVADILVGAYGYPYESSQYYRGAAYLFLTQPSSSEVLSFDISNGDGEGGNILCAEAGGKGRNDTNKIGSGIYTFYTNFTNSWTVYQTSEIIIEFKLKGQLSGLSYIFGYSPQNDTYYIIDSYENGLEVVPEHSDFTTSGYHYAELNLSFRINRNFLTQDPFDVIFNIVMGRFLKTETREDMLRVEKDLTFDNIDMKVMLGDSQLERGAVLSGGEPLRITGLRAVYEETDVSPGNDKFFVRVKDNYLRVFENRSSAGLEIDIRIPTNVDSGIFRLWVEQILYPEYELHATSVSNIPGFYVSLDFDGPFAPQNLKFHADSIDDPEGRWDNDNQVWISWDPAFDTQVGVIGYKYQVRGPGSFMVTGDTEDRFTELTLGESGVYTIQIWGIDEAGNPGRRGIKSIVIDREDLTLFNHYPSYTGNIWFNSKEVELRVSISDLVVGDNSPMLDLSTLKYLVTDNMNGEPTEEMWENDGVRALYTILSLDRGENYVYTLSVPVQLSEGTENFIWWSVADEAGNRGTTKVIDVDQKVEDLYIHYRDTVNLTDNMAREKAEESRPDFEKEAISRNPANAWVDIQAPTFSDPTPDPEPQEDSRITATIIIEDQGLDLSGVDASTIQYSVSRDGISNYGGWISAGLTDDSDTILASSTELLFEPGSTNYVRWRVKDIAGNGFVVSDDFPINIVYKEVNNPPLASISAPEMHEVYDTQQKISFEGSDSIDPDLDNLQFKWVLANKTILSEEADFEVEASSLGQGVHVITLYVTDGWFTITDSISFYVKIHPSEIDTDGDGLPDGEDLDDDGDELTDQEELSLGTNPKIADTDQDGMNDYLDADPLNPLIIDDEDETGYSTYFGFMVWIVVLAILILIVAVMIVLKKRSTLEKNRVTRNVTREASMVQRYEALTGIEPELLPSVKEMGLSLPPVSAQQVVPRGRVEKEKKREKTEPEETEEPAKPVQPEPAPAPAPAPAKAPAPAGSVPGKIPKPEDLAATPNLPGNAESAGTTILCDLCGSSVEVPPGAAQVECPLCGTKKQL
ncbi:MAG: FG-GAP-like repeat-containing protein [Thermoplasmatota archaeon]